MSTSSLPGRDRAPASHQHSPDLELLRIVPLKEAARLRGVSVDTLRRQHRGKFIRIGKRHFGMRVKDAIAGDEGARS
jgi:hypothetical protein